MRFFQIILEHFYQWMKRFDERLKIKLFLLLFLSFVFFCAKAEAVTYYVDFDSGDDTNTGISAESAWKHCPGDTNASGIPAAASLLPGDTLLFKGGVYYRGNIKVKGSGTSDSLIIYKGDGWPGLENEKAIIDGSEIVSGWTQCQSAEECGGNPNWANIYYSTLPSGTSPLAANLHEDDEFLWIAQDPNPPDPYFFDTHEHFYPVSNSNITRTSIVDTTYFTQSSSSDWDYSYVLIWGNPNRVYLKKITAYIPAEHKITFDDLGVNAIYPDARDQYYSLYNSLKVLDQPGEYYVKDISDGNGKYQVFLWPRNPADLTDKISVSVRKFGFDISTYSYLKMQGFKIQKFNGSDLRDGIGIGTITADYVDKYGIIISDNIITHNRHSSGGYGGIFINKVHDCLIENNLIDRNPAHRGIFCSSSENVIVKNNNLIRPGGTCIPFYTSKNCRIIGNTIREAKGTHANGITLYLSCENILVYGNKIYDSLTPITIQNSGNLYFINNFIDAYNATNNVDEWGDTSNSVPVRGTIAFLNNTLVRNSRNSSLNIGRRTENTYIVKNNIIDGGGGGMGININRSHNLYIGLCWDQSSNYGWSLASGEFVETDLSKIFADPQNNDYHLKETSVVMDKGCDVTSNLPLSAFPDFDFNKDMDGNSRPPGSLLDIGAYEYMFPIPPVNLSAASVAARKIRLTWSDASSNEDGFRIERSLNGTDFVEIAQPGVNVSEYTDTGLTINTTYYYRVRAYNDAGNSSYSNILEVQTSNTKPVITPVTAITKYEGEKVEFDVMVSDVNVLDEITLDGTGMPEGSTLTPTETPRTWRFSWQTDFNDSGTQTIVFNANDGTEDSDSVNVGITLNAVSTNLSLRDHKDWN